MTFLKYLPLLCVLLAHPATGAESDPFDALEQLAKRGVAVTALAVDVQSGETLAQLSPQQRLVPASLSKLFTAAVTLNYWGLNHTFVSRLQADAEIRDNQLQGNLVLWSEGDPGLVSHHLWSLAIQLQQAGVSQINGDLLVNVSRFGVLPCKSADRCHAQRRSRNAYNAGLSSVGVNYGTWCLKIIPASKVDQPATLRLCPLQVETGVELVNRVKTVAAGTVLERERVTDHQRGIDRIIVSGRIATGSDPAHLYVSSGNVGQQAGYLLKQHLTALGVTLKGQVRLTDEPLAEQPVLAEIRGDKLATLNRNMLAYSNNFMADMLTLNLMAELLPDEPLDLAVAGRLVLQKAHEDFGVPLTATSKIPAALSSGSGLSLDSRLSADDLVALLTGVYRQTAIFPAFLSGLTVPEFSPLGILRGPEADWKHRVMVKSGSLNEPYTVYGMAGYLRTRDDRWVAFAILLNGTAKQPKLPYADSMTLLRQSVIGLVNLPTSAAGK